MTTPSMIPIRRFSASLRLKLHVVIAEAWEALAETYGIQAVRFVQRMAAWLPIDEALDRYLREVGVPSTMADTVRARALVALAPEVDRLATASAPADLEPDAAPWGLLRLDRLAASLRQRARQVEAANLQCRLATCVATEAVAETHIRMAFETAALLDGELPPDEAIAHYVRTFNLPALEGQLVFRRAMACWAEHHVPSAEAATSCQPAAGIAEGTAESSTENRLKLAPAAGLGLRLRATG